MLYSRFNSSLSSAAKYEEMNIEFHHENPSNTMNATEYEREHTLNHTLIVHESNTLQNSKTLDIYK